PIQPCHDGRNLRIELTAPSLNLTPRALSRAGAAASVMIQPEPMAELAYALAGETAERDTDLCVRRAGAQHALDGRLAILVDGHRERLRARWRQLTPRAELRAARPPALA